MTLLYPRNVDLDDEPYIDEVDEDYNDDSFDEFDDWGDNFDEWDDDPAMWDDE